MPAVLLSPLYNASQQFGPNGTPLPGALLHTYLAGTDTDAATYTDESGNTENENPIEFDASGYPPGEIWLESGVAYKLYLTDANGDPIPGHTNDNVLGISAGGAGGAIVVSGSNTEGFVVTPVTVNPATQIVFDQGFQCTENGSTVQIGGPQTAIFSTEMTDQSINDDPSSFDYSLVKPASFADVGGEDGNPIITEDGWYRVSVRVDFTAVDLYGSPANWFNNVVLFGTALELYDSPLSSIIGRASSVHQTGYADSYQISEPGFSFTSYDCLTTRTVEDTYIVSVLGSDVDPPLIGLRAFVASYNPTVWAYNATVLMTVEKLPGGVPAAS